MKKLAYIISLLLISNLAIGQLTADDKWKENIVKNNIQTQSQWNHKYSKGKPVRKGYQNFIKTFDKKGNVIEEIFFKAGSINQKLSYKYDNNENKVEFENYKGNEGKLMYKQNITYDKANRKTKEERFDGTEKFVIDYKYDGKGKLLEITRTDEEDRIIQKRTFVYTGNICDVIITNEENKRIGKIVNTYDNFENIIESIEYDINGKVKEKYTFKFDKKLLKEKVKYAVGNFIYKEDYKYDLRGNLIEIKKEQPEGTSRVNNIYKYDSNDNLIEEQWYDNNPNEYSKKTYFYSSKGVLEKVEVYYSLYKYKIQYRFDYTHF